MTRRGGNTPTETKLGI